MLTKLIFVGFFSPIEMSCVIQPPALNPFSRKKVKSKKVLGNYCSFCFVLPYPCIAKTMNVADNFITYMQMMNLSLRIPFTLSMKIFDIGTLLILSIFSNFISSEYIEVFICVYRIFYLHSLLCKKIFSLLLYYPHTL